METRGYCGKCEEDKEVVEIFFDNNRMIIEFECGHEIMYRMVTL